MCETNNIDGHGVRRDLSADEISGFKEYIKRKVSNQKRVIASLNQIQKDDKDTIYDDFPFLEDNFQFAKIYPYKDDKTRIQKLDQDMKWLINPENPLNNSLQYSTLMTIYKHLTISGI